MAESSCTRKVALDRAFCIALLSVAVSVVSVVIGYYLAIRFSEAGFGDIAIREVNPYKGCQLLPEWISRAAGLCRPVLLQAFLLWIAPYTKFDALLTAAVFIDRGISLGLSLRFCIAGAADVSVSLLPLFHTVVSAVLIFFAYSLRDSRAVRPLRDTFVHFLIATGFSFIIYTVSPWIL
ncbi:MAG: hypothetical protein IIW82_03775 [Clostridia bacterium]|nr:hypothetical protein [Clostridia bacterium]MBQ5886752.1 hypothetical protein [Clostridia bacterium]